MTGSTPARRTGRRALALTAGIAVLLLGTGAAADEADEAVSVLRQDPVFVHPSARTRLTPEQAERLRNRIARGPVPVFIAVFPRPSGPDGSEDPLAREIAVRLHRRGVVAVVRTTLSVHPSAGATIDHATLEGIAEQVRRSHRGTGEVFIVLADLVTQVQRAALEAGADLPVRPNLDPAPARRPAATGTWGLWVLLSTVACGWVVLRIRSRRAGPADPDPGRDPNGRR